MMKQYIGILMTLIILSSCRNDVGSHDTGGDSSAKIAGEIIDEEQNEDVLRNADGEPIRMIDSSRVEVIDLNGMKPSDIQEILEKS